MQDMTNNPPTDFRKTPGPRQDERLPGNPNRRRYIHLAVLAGVVIGMFGFAYANAEFFIMVCQRAGLLSEDPSRLRTEIVEGEPGRPLEVYFSANVADRLPIAFSVDNSYQRTRINQRAINDYRFVNLSDRTIYFRPVHDVSPVQAGRDRVMELEKCFCFELQKIGPGESYSLPVVYRFTDELDERTRTIRMSYTLFESDKASYDAAQRAIEAGLDPKVSSH